jgi:hypothetical protein
MGTSATPLGAFDALADVAGVRHPQPHRQNKGLCPAHDDHNNPGLSFTLSATTGNLLVHCFARECSPVDIAASIGLPLSAFFTGSQVSGSIPSRITWRYPSILDLLRLMPIGYSWEKQRDSVFDVIEACNKMGDGTYDFDSPYHELPYIVARDVIVYAYLRRHWEMKGEPPWPEYGDQAMRLIRRLSLDNKTNDVT